MWRVLVYGPVVVLALALLAILAAMRLQRYKHEYPDKLVSALFAPGSTYLPEKSESGLLRATAMGFAVALEHNRDVNAAKARWTMVASYGVFVAVLALAMLLASAAYLKLN